MVPAWKPELALPKDVPEAIAAEWFCDEVSQQLSLAVLFATAPPQRLAVTIQSD
jgi:hypothetical protein